jgi:hypothetical protein
MGKKLLVTIALTGAMLALPATAAFAHDCFVADRSTQGARGSGHSALATNFEHGWVTFDVSDLLAQAEVSDVDAALAEWVAAGHPAALATRVDTVIGEGSSNPNLGNGKGLEHFSESPLVGDLVALILKYGGDPSLLED